METKLEEDKLVSLALAFHLKTGADIQLIQQFIRDIVDINTSFAIKVMKEEIHKVVK
jgi:hypothetical protein